MSNNTTIPAAGSTPGAPPLNPWLAGTEGLARYDFHRERGRSPAWALAAAVAYAERLARRRAEVAP
jgi:hypothetical protein